MHSHFLPLLRSTAGALLVSGLASHAFAAAPSWRSCTAAADDAARLACFDQWAAEQSPPASAQSEPRLSLTQTTPVAPTAPESEIQTAALEPTVRGCNNPTYSPLTRFWELSEETDCDTFVLRGYRPISLSVVAADEINRAPSSPTAGHQAESLPYRHTETRLNLSVRTKLAKGLLARSHARQDSLWFGYTQQSYWQLLNPHISRPFRTTDHEPELIYVYPVSLKLPGGWSWAYAGAGLSHQSNGQSLPLSRSWNRWYLMAGLEKGHDWTLTGRIWKRVSENAADDDNPGISNYIGRGELTATWHPHHIHSFSATVRSSLNTHSRGSVRLEWLRTLGKGLAGGRSNLRLHTQLFSGYGDSLIDYNYKRTVLSVGLTLLDF